MILNGPGISYTEPDIGAEFVPPLPEHPREAIVKLCEHCTNRLLHRDELLGYEYWSFAEAATDEQAEVLCKMKMRRPYTLPEMVKLTGMPEADIEKMLDDMSYTGLLEYNWENPERAKQWVLPMLVPGSAEFLNMRVSQLEEHPVYAVQGPAVPCYADGAARRRRHRHARDPGREGHRRLEHLGAD